MANTIIHRNKFPECLKLAQVTSIYKKDDPFTEKNCRPVSILPSLSKLCARVISDHLIAHFENIFHSFLAGFRPTIGRQTTLLRLIEDWKKALDDNFYVGAILMDLSNALDCTHPFPPPPPPHAFQLMHSYLSDRKQRVKLGNIVSQWQNIRTSNFQHLYQWTEGVQIHTKHSNVMIQISDVTISTICNDVTHVTNEW